MSDHVVTLDSRRDNVRDNPDAGDVVTVVVGKIAKHTNGDLRGPAPSGLVFIALLYSEFCYWRRWLLGLGIPRPKSSPVRIAIVNYLLK